MTKRPAIANNGRGVHAPSTDAEELVAALSERLRLVRVCCGDWSRVCTPAVTTGVHPETAVFLDPPYGVADRETVYTHDDRTVSEDVLEWCRKRGREMKVAVCGYEGEYNALEAEGWEVVFWKAKGGYSNQNKDGSNNNACRERIWFSPKCWRPPSLF